MSLKGKLLVASPTLIDPHFFRSVVLIIEHDADGAVGVIVNRPTDIPTSEHLPEWSDRLGLPSVVFEGGPVARESALGLGRVTGDEVDTVLGDVAVVDLTDLDPRDVSDVRVFSGYAGWTGGQLDMEVAVDGWFVVDAVVGDALDTEPLTLWRRVLQRQRNKLGLYAHYPEDIRVN